VKAQFPIGQSFGPTEMKFFVQQRWFLFALFALLFVTVPYGFRSLGFWLVVQDSLKIADAIVVFGGHLPFRAMEAAKIYKEGMAPEIWVSCPATTTESTVLEELDIGFVSENEYSVRILRRFGVPASAIRLVDGEIVNTEDEIRVVVGTLQERGKSCAILVTSEYHCRRLKIIWHSLAPSDLEAIVRFTPDDPFDPDRWWYNSRDALAVTREIGGILNAWAGFPLQPVKAVTSGRADQVR